MSKHRLTPAEQLMNQSHQTINRLKSMVPELIKQRDAALKSSEHWQSQAMMISDMAIPVALQNQQLKERVAYLESLLPNRIAIGIDKGSPDGDDTAVVKMEMKDGVATVVDSMILPVGAGDGVALEKPNEVPQPSNGI